MRTLDWRIDCLPSIWADSIVHRDGENAALVYRVIRSLDQADNWVARFCGKELTRSSLPKCLAACEESEASAAVTEMRARTADGQSLTPAELGLPTELPGVTIEVTPALAANLRCLVGETLTDSQLGEVGLSVGRDGWLYVVSISPVGESYEVVLRSCPEPQSSSNP